MRLARASGPCANPIWLDRDSQCLHVGEDEPSPRHPLEGEQGHRAPLEAPHGRQRSASVEPPRTDAAVCSEHSGWLRSRSETEESRTSASALWRRRRSRLHTGRRFGIGRRRSTSERDTSSRMTDGEHRPEQHRGVEVGCSQGRSRRSFGPYLTRQSTGARSSECCRTGRGVEHSV